MKNTPTILSLVMLVGHALGGATARADILISDDFSGDNTTPLVGTTADVGGTWIGSGNTAMKADGTSPYIAGSTGERVAYQPFTLTAGETYTLSADVKVNTGSLNFIGIGFASSAGGLGGTDSVWNASDPYAWIYLNGNTVHGIKRITQHVGAANELKIGDTVLDTFVNLKVVLDTSNASNYQATWFVDGVEKATASIGAPSLDHVFTAVHNDTSGAIDNFVLADGTSGPDTNPPSLTGTNPADDATGVAVGAALVVSFDEAVQAGATGAITLWKNLDPGPDELVETFAVTSSSRLSFGGASVTIEPTNDLAGGDEYYVLIDADAIEDTSSNGFAGITDPTSWSFTTATTPPPAAAGVIKLDLSTAGDGDGGSLADRHQLNNGGTIPAGSVIRHGDGAVVPGATITVDAPATSGFNNDPNAGGWGGIGSDPYYIPAADDLVYTVPGPLTVTFGGLDNGAAYNVRVYALINEGLAPLDITVTDGAGSISRTGLNRSALFATVPLSPDLVFDGVATDGSGNIVVSIDSTAALSAEAVVLETVDPAAPVARFTAAPTTGLAPLEVTFTDTSTPGSGGAITTCSWDFGDGGLGNTATGPGATVTHTYNTTGIYQATLTVTAADGKSDSTSLAINAGGGGEFFRIDASAPGAVISPYLFGHNLEVTRRAVWSGLGAQMVANRKFAAVASGMPKQWTAIANGGGSVASDGTVGYAGTRSARVDVATAGQPCGIRQQQAQLAFQQDRDYQFRAWVKTDLGRDVLFRITDGAGASVIGEGQAAIATGDWQLLEGSFTAPATAENCRLEITSDTTGTFRIGAVSVLPADHFHGMRRDVVELLKQVKPGALRFPGGCYEEFYEWEDGLLPVDQRPPIGPTGLGFLLPNTDDYDTHEIGTDEFIALCREIGCEPSITIRMSGKTATDVAGWVEYCNGAADTTWGAIRAARGQPEPYAVKTWFLGNELWSFGRDGMNNATNCGNATKAFGDAILAVDPSVRLVGCLNGGGGWTSTVLGLAGDVLSHGSYHRYEGSPSLAAAAKAGTTTVRPVLQGVHAAYGRPVTFDEWNTYWGRAGTIGMGLYAAGVTNLLCRESADLGVDQAYYFQPITEGAIKVTPTSAALDSAGQVFAAIAVHQGNRLLPLPPTVASADLDACASLRDDGRVFVTVINRDTSTSHAATLTLADSVITAATASLLVAHTVTDAETVFDEQTETLAPGGGSVTVSLPRYSLAVVEITTATSNYQAWAFTHGLTGAPGSATDPAFAADPNRDGVANGLVWILGGESPLADSRGLLPVAERDDTGAMTLTFNRRQDAFSAEGHPDLIVQYGGSLTDWTDLPVPAPGAPPLTDGNGVRIEITGSGGSPLTDQIKVTFPQAVAPNGKLFARLAATE